MVKLYPYGCDIFVAAKWLSYSQLENNVSEGQYAIWYLRKSWLAANIKTLDEDIEHIHLETPNFCRFNDWYCDMLFKILVKYLFFAV